MAAILLKKADRGQKLEENRTPKVKLAAIPVCKAHDEKGATHAKLFETGRPGGPGRSRKNVKAKVTAKRKRKKQASKLGGNGNLVEETRKEAPDEEDSALLGKMTPLGLQELLNLGQNKLGVSGELRGRSSLRPRARLRVWNFSVFGEIED